MKNEHSMMDNQDKPQGASASLNTSAATPKKEEPNKGNKQGEKEKTKRRQGSHSAGAGRNR
ncbi:MAG TPA: hypothetical protein VLB68_07140 [Pyrinomonadaceae bacterium]|nr:hypothetical protein [Pyrinomonadaceae bacterium]